MEISNWLKSMFAFLADQTGEDDPNEEEEAEEGDEDEGEEEEEGGEEESEEEDGEEEESEEDGDDDSGTNGGKKRSDMIPRKRFDQVNAKAKQVERLVELGILQEGADGELHLTEKGRKAEEEKGEKKGSKDFYFKEDEVDEKSWPLVEKINKGFQHFEGLANKMAFLVVQLQSENAVLRDYPEFLQKNSPLRKRAMEIIKNDPEFKRTYHNNPEKGYWAVKRAAELLEGKGGAPVKKKKSSFIISKGDGSKGGPKKVLDFSKMTKEELDELEKSEHKRMNGNGNRFQKTRK